MPTNHENTVTFAHYYGNATLPVGHIKSLVSADFLSHDSDDDGFVFDYGYKDEHGEANYFKVCAPTDTPCLDIQSVLFATDGQCFYLGQTTKQFIQAHNLTY